MIDVNEVAEVLEIDYEQEQFPGMVYRVENPKVCILLFRSGKAVATGAKSVNDMEVAFSHLRSDLEKHDFDIWDESDTDLTLHNIVVTCDVSDVFEGDKLNLSNLMFSLPFERTEYEPEQFPGLIYRTADLPVVYLIFSSGRCVITGSKNFEEVAQAEEILRMELAECTHVGTSDRID